MSAARRDLDWSAASMMQSYIIQFERLPTAGTDRCLLRQPAFYVAEPLVCQLYETLREHNSCVLNVREGDTHSYHCASGVMITDVVTIFMFS